MNKNSTQNDINQLFSISSTPANSTIVPVSLNLTPHSYILPLKSLKTHNLEIFYSLSILSLPISPLVLSASFLPIFLLCMG